MSHTTSQIEIDLTRLDDNYRAWRSVVAEPCQICPVVKADAYGLGAVPITRRLVGQGVEIVAVYNMQQASEIAKAGLNVKMLVLMPIEELDRTDILYRSLVNDKLHLTVHSEQQLGRIEAIGTMFGVKMPIHIEVDTGMGRLGMSVAEADEIIGGLPGRKYLRLAGLFSHTAAPGTDEAFTAAQHEEFESLLNRHAERLADVCVHFSGTCAAYRDEQFHKSMIRLGLGLYGYGDLAEEDVSSIVDPPTVRPILRWMSRIVHTKQISRGASVGYQRTFTAKRKTRLGVVPVGHADGYPFALSNKAVVRIGKELHEAPVRGLVNMDQISVDLTGLPDQVGVGSEVELISADTESPNALTRLANLAGSNCYELLCRLSPRIERHYIVHDRVTGRAGHVATV